MGSRGDLVLGPGEHRGLEAGWWTMEGGALEHPGQGAREARPRGGGRGPGMVESAQAWQRGCAGTAWVSRWELVPPDYLALVRIGGLSHDALVVADVLEGLAGEPPARSMYRCCLAC